MSASPWHARRTEALQSPSYRTREPRRANSEVVDCIDLHCMLPRDSPAKLHRDSCDILPTGTSNVLRFYGVLHSSAKLLKQSFWRHTNVISHPGQHGPCHALADEVADQEVPSSQALGKRPAELGAVPQPLDSGGLGPHTLHITSLSCAFSQHIPVPAVQGLCGRDRQQHGPPKR